MNGRNGSLNENSFFTPSDGISVRQVLRLTSCGRYWDRLVDMLDLDIHIDEIPTWFEYYTIG